MGIDFKFNISTKIKINGKEYGSVEEVPEELRGTVQNALGRTKPGFPGTEKITLDGVTYESPDDMPADIREIYEEVLRRAAEEKARADARRAAMPGPVPESVAFKPLIIGILIALAVFALIKLI